jgi:hypothetical protein
MMREKGVDTSTVESWGVYWDQLTMAAGTCKASDLKKIGSQMASSFTTALYYIKEKETHG